MASKIAIFGGSFDPIHMGHISCVKTVLSKLNLKKAIVIPSFKSPLKSSATQTDGRMRMNMTKLAFARWSKKIETSDIELKRKDTSYTIDTIKRLQRKLGNAELNLVIGADQLLQFHEWKQFEEILERVNLVVCSRPGVKWPITAADLPKAMFDLLSAHTKKIFELKSGQKIFFVKLENIDISSSELRKKISKGESVNQFVPKKVVDYIEENDLYQLQQAEVASEEKYLHFCAQALYDKKGFAITAKDMREVSGISDFAVICSSTSRVHASSLADHVVRSVKTDFGFYPLNVEGKEESRWIVIDYGFLIVHVFYDFTRQEYQLEKLWQDVPDLELSLK